VTEGDPIKRAIRVVMGVCVAIALVGGVYFLAEYRAKPAKPTLPQFTPPPATPGEPIEANGLEGIFVKDGFVVTALDGKTRGWGLQTGDTIRTIGQQPATSGVQLHQLVAGVQLQAERPNGDTLELTIGDNARLRGNDARPVDVRGLTGQVTPEGLWVSTFEGDAATWGLRTGDLIRNANGHPLSVRRDCITLLRSLDPAAGIMFEIMRKGSRIYLPYNSPNRGVRVATAPQQPAAWAGAWAPAHNRTCAVCGARHGPGWNRTTCGQCGAQFMSRPVAGAGTQVPCAPGLQRPGGRW